MKVAEKYIMNYMQYITDEDPSFDTLLLMKSIVNAAIKIDDNVAVNADIIEISSIEIVKYYHKIYWNILVTTSKFDKYLDTQIVEQVRELISVYEQNIDEKLEDYDLLSENFIKLGNYYEVFISRMNKLICLNTLKKHRHFIYNESDLFRVDEKLEHIILSSAEIALIRLNVHDINVNITKRMFEKANKYSNMDKEINFDLDIQEENIKELNIESTSSTFDEIERATLELFKSLGLGDIASNLDEDDEFKN